MGIEFNTKVLVVDDEKHILSSIKRLFIDHDNVDVITTTSPIEALEIIKSEDVALIVSDNMMNEMKGVELLSKVRNLSPDTVRILMTAYADLPTALVAINTNEVFRFIVKPWENSVMIETIDEAINRFNLIRSLSEADEGTMLSLAQTIELKDPYTKGHCDRVAVYALAIADAVDIPERDMKTIKHGAWLHDCGKIGVPESILNFAGPLNDNEMDTIKKHPEWGVDVIRHARVSDKVKNIILYHHERFDGKGYPFGKKGEDIPLEARIVAVADVYDALITDRPYRKKYNKEEVKEMVLSMVGTFFDPKIVTSFFSILDGIDLMENDPA